MISGWGRDSLLVERFHFGSAGIICLQLWCCFVSFLDYSIAVHRYSNVQEEWVSFIWLLFGSYPCRKAFVFFSRTVFVEGYLSALHLFLIPQQLLFPTSHLCVFYWLLSSWPQLWCSFVLLFPLMEPFFSSVVLLCRVWCCNMMLPPFECGLLSLLMALSSLDSKSVVKFRVQNGQSTSFWQDVWL